MNKEEYNKVPIYYCDKCLSLRIFNVPCLDESEYCDECGSTNILRGQIEDWEKLYIARYGHSFLNHKY